MGLLILLMDAEYGMPNHNDNNSNNKTDKTTKNATISPYRLCTWPNALGQSSPSATAAPQASSYSSAWNSFSTAARKAHAKGLIQNNCSARPARKQARAHAHTHAKTKSSVK